MTFEEEVENLCQPFLDVPSINWIGSLEELSYSKEKLNAVSVGDKSEFLPKMHGLDEFFGVRHQPLDLGHSEMLAGTQVPIGRPSGHHCS